MVLVNYNEEKASGSSLLYTPKLVNTSPSYQNGGNHSLEFQINENNKRTFAIKLKETKNGTNY